MGIDAQVGLSLVQHGARGSRLTPSKVVLTEWSVRLLDLPEEVHQAVAGLREGRSRDLAVQVSMSRSRACCRAGWCICASGNTRAAGPRL